MTTQTGESGLDDLDVLVGRWDLVSSLGSPDASPQAVATFEWLEGRKFLIQRWHVDHPDAPDGIAVIGYDDERATFLMPPREHEDDHDKGDAEHDVEHPVGKPEGKHVGKHG